MQTFLPYPDFKKSAECLDRQRLGKQRSEVKQIINALNHGGGWRNHPAAKMWAGHRGSLVLYGLAICAEWVRRGYKDAVSADLQTMLKMLPTSEATLPRWVGNDAFHASHRSNLLRKDPEHYGRFGWREGPDLEYVWPTPAGERKVKTIYRGYDIETDSDGKVTSVTKDGQPVKETFDNLPTSEAVMAKIDLISGDKPKPKAEAKPKTPKKMSEAEGIADRKKQSDVVQGKTKTTYDKDGEYDWASLDEKTLRGLFKQMQAASGTKIADIPEGAKLEEIRTTCKNVHNYFRVRATEAKNVNNQTKATKQENTMAKKAVKKTAAKKTAKKAAKKAAAEPKVEKFAGFPLDAKVVVKNKTNPAREGNAKWKRWDTVLSGKYKTIGDLKKAKANPGTIRNAVKAKSITVG